MYLMLHHVSHSITMATDKLFYLLIILCHYKFSPSSLHWFWIRILLSLKIYMFRYHPLLSILDFSILKA